ncbi:CopG family transcriptional regulator [Caedibacter taeniospiralis]|uniref:CopG family transcriptional regulator n=1 Tax=Caedibacter taeniospiralis TaxID=28907 RepID=UPI0013023CFF|nr:CopG family transcriptional regulator [Caedibacter taeniospiralis]
MRSVVSVRLNEHLLQAVKSNANFLHVSQTEYIRKAIEYMNVEMQRQINEAKLKKASLKVRRESMKINAEFGEIERDPE